ncbi:uncharacterized protein [Watersipora subatra]|uniref:uncharacterized protein n=1 Tax=Watersipora subatra TaxID=2589382 RepID=UPI00355AE2DA
MTLNEKVLYSRDVTFQESRNDFENPTLDRESTLRRQVLNTSVLASAVHKLQREPSLAAEAIKMEHKDLWKSAVQTEMNTLLDQKIWELTELLKGRKLVGRKWVFKIKTDSENIECYIARLVARRFSKMFGENYDETFSLIIRIKSLRVLFSLSERQNCNFSK